MNKKLQGMSLIELTIGLGIGCVLTTAFISFYANTSKSNNTMLKTIKLEHELQSSINLMKSDIRRIGYNSKAIDLIGTNNINKFMINNITDINIPKRNCILFSYDFNKSGTVPSLNTQPMDNRFGFRLLNGIVQARAKYDKYFNCNKGTWYNLTDPMIIEVTLLSFTLTKKTLAKLSSREVTIKLSARLVSNKLINRTLTSRVKIRNDKYTPQT